MRLTVSTFITNKKGKPIGSNDMWIAAIALELDNELLTLDDDFKNISDLMLGSI